MLPLLECNLVSFRTTRQDLGTSPERSVEIQDENAPSAPSKKTHEQDKWPIPSMRRACRESCYLGVSSVAIGRSVPSLIRYHDITRSQTVTFAQTTD